MNDLVYLDRRMSNAIKGILIINLFLSLPRIELRRLNDAEMNRKIKRCISPKCTSY